MIDYLAQKATDDMDLDDLMAFFYSDQYDYYDNLSDEELMEVIKEDEQSENP